MTLKNYASRFGILLASLFVLQRVAIPCNDIDPESVPGFSLTTEVDPKIQSDGGSTVQLWKKFHKKSSQKVLNILIYKSNQIFVQRFMVESGRLKWVKTATLLAKYDYEQGQLDFSETTVANSSYTLLSSANRTGFLVTCDSKDAHAKVVAKANVNVERDLKREFLKYWALIEK